jgi:hypothetical protein
MQAEFGQKLAEIRTASKLKQVAYILGRTEPHWKPQVADIIYRLFRPYVTALATKCKHLMKLGSNGGLRVTPIINMTAENNDPIRGLLRTSRDVRNSRMKRGSLST